MRVLYSNTWLAPGGIEGTIGATWDGVQVNDEAAFFRAAAAVHYARGGRSRRFAFRVQRFFATEAAAILFATVNTQQLPLQADLLVYADDADDDAPAAQLTGAVVDGVRVLAIVGSSLSLEYAFRGGEFTTDDITLPTEDDLVKRGVVNLTEGEETKAVAFAQAFAAAPVIAPGIQAPAGGYVFDVVIRDVTTEGFTAVFGAMVPGPNYKLHYIAILP